MNAALQGSQLALYNQFRPALENYHTGGFKNGGGIDGVQLPPGVTQDQLEPFLDSLSTYMAQQPGIDVLQPPSNEPEAQFRKDIQTKSAAAVEAHKQAYIKIGTSMIHNPAIAGMVQTALQAAPKEWWDAFSSSSGRFHPPDEINDGGLVLHSLRNMIVADKLVNFFNSNEDVNVIGNQHIDSDRRDLIVAGEMLHDIEKGGIPWDKYNPGHGPLGASFLQGVWKNDPHQDWAGKMEEMVNDHMAQWNVDPGPAHEKEPIVPKDIDNQIFSYADYLGSQRNVLVQPTPGSDE